MPAVSLFSIRHRRLSMNGALTCIGKSFLVSFWTVAKVQIDERRRRQWLRVVPRREKYHLESAAQWRRWRRGRRRVGGTAVEEHPNHSDRLIAISSHLKPKRRRTARHARDDRRRMVAMPSFAYPRRHREKSMRKTAKRPFAISSPGERVLLLQRWQGRLRKHMRIFKSATTAHRAAPIQANPRKKRRSCCN